MTGDDAVDDRQPDAGAFEVFRLVQPLEHAEQFFGMSHVEADAVVADEIHVSPFVDRAADRDRGAFGGGRELHRVARRG